MGFALQNAVLDSGLRPTWKLILVAMARWADDDGSNAFIGVAKVQKLTGFGQRAIKKNIHEMVEAGVLVVASGGGGRGNKTNYRIDLNSAPETPYEMHPKPETVHDVPETVHDVPINGAPNSTASLLTIERLESTSTTPEWLRELLEDFEGPPVKVTVEKALEYQASKGLTDDRCAETVTGMMSKISWNEKAKHYELAKSGTGRATAYKNLWAVFRTWVARPQLAQASNNGYRPNASPARHDSIEPYTKARIAWKGPNEPEIEPFTRFDEP